MSIAWGYVLSKQNCCYRLNDLQSQAKDLEEKLAEEDVCRLDAQQVAADQETLRHKHANLVTQHEATFQCAEEASATAVALRSELDASQTDVATTSRELEASNAAAEELRKTVVALRQEVTEHREKDAEVIARIQDAKEASDQVHSHPVFCPVKIAVSVCSCMPPEESLHETIPYCPI